MWTPPLTEKQLEFYLSPKRIRLAYGPRVGGKSRAVLNTVMRHLWQHNARFAIITKTTRQGSYGVWSTLTDVIFRQWQDSRVASDIAEFGWSQAPRKDAITKIHNAKIRNSLGGESEIVLFPISNPTEALAKLLSTEWSGIWISEAHLFTGNNPQEMLAAREIFDTSLGQLRLDGVDFEDTLLLVDSNPSKQGTKHWCYDAFFVEPTMTEFPPWLPEDKIQFIKSNQRHFGAYKFPIDSNTFLHPGLKAQIIAQYAHDPFEFARNVNGDWIDGVISGVFSKVFSRQRHVLGDAEERSPEDWEVIAPTNGPNSVSDGGLPLIICGWDPGDVNHSWSALQPVYEGGVLKFRLLDEVVVTRGEVSLEDFTGLVLEKMDALERFAGFKIEWRHFSDSSAFQFRSAISRNDIPLNADMCDAAIIEAVSKGRITLEGAQEVKNPGWVKRRVMFVSQLLRENRFVASANCKLHIAMFCALRRGKGIAYLAPEQEEKHPFDSMSYAVCMYALDEILTGGIETATVGRMVSV